jgi:hypothetical protein
MADKRIRLEFIMSQALEDDFLREIEKVLPACKYTQLTGVHGKGYSVPKLGDAVWPQENTLFVLYVAEYESEKIVEVINALRKEYTGEGLACFRSEMEEI